MKLIMYFEINKTFLLCPLTKNQYHSCMQKRRAELCTRFHSQFVAFTENTLLLKVASKLEHTEPQHLEISDHTEPVRLKLRKNPILSLVYGLVGWLG